MSRDIPDSRTCSQGSAVRVFVVRRFGVGRRGDVRCRGNSRVAYSLGRPARCSSSARDSSPRSMGAAGRRWEGSCDREHAASDGLLSGEAGSPAAVGWQLEGGAVDDQLTAAVEQVEQAQLAFGRSNRYCLSTAGHGIRRRSAGASRARDNFLTSRCWPQPPTPPAARSGVFLAFSARVSMASSLHWFGCGCGDTEGVPNAAVSRVGPAVSAGTSTRGCERPARDRLLTCSRQAAYIGSQTAAY
jgi:hypothetical protein